ncbi:hypothetical protein [Roseiconus lacunae]|uniref:hypothetical protein n=1 Tax=Roseiconus lacunae TaxID=2605694 RepID=UPI0011F27EB9|nr:hypothetical protein [Roseiconus lacunae]
MSRLDKQLDRLSGEEPVRIEWTDESDLPRLRTLLINEVDRHIHRIPLDLRGIDGAPPELVELLLEIRRYAVSKSKILSMSWILPPMRDAIERKLHRPAGSVVAPSADPDSEQASDLAKELLHGVEKSTEYDLSKAQKIQRRRAKRRSSAKKGLASRLVRYLIMASGIIACVAVISVVYFFATSEPPKILDRKSFENNREAISPVER